MFLSQNFNIQSLIQIYSPCPLLYIAACGIGRKKPVGFRPTGCSSVYIQLLTVYIIAPIRLRCNTFFSNISHFLQSNSFSPFKHHFTLLFIHHSLLSGTTTCLQSPRCTCSTYKNSARRTAVFPAFRTSCITCPMYKSIPWQLDGFNKISCNSYGRIDVCACLW